MSLAIFGGTFDPIHLGHTHIATVAKEVINLDKIIFIPCKQSPHKKSHSLATEKQRLEMCQLSTAEFPWAEVDDHDLTAPVPSYSWRTAEAMKDRFPNAQLFWLMGTDQWDTLSSWNRAEYLAILVEFIVFSRNSIPKPHKDITMHPISGNHPASATEIRQCLFNQLKPPWLNPQVAEFIEIHQLYGHC